MQLIVTVGHLKHPRGVLKRHTAAVCFEAVLYGSNYIRAAI